MGNQTWLAEVLFEGISEREREHVLDVMSEVTDAELRRLRAQSAGKMPVTVNRPRALSAEAGVERVGQLLTLS